MRYMGEVIEVIVVVNFIFTDIVIVVVLIDVNVDVIFINVLIAAGSVVVADIAAHDSIVAGIESVTAPTGVVAELLRCSLYLGNAPFSMFWRVNRAWWIGGAVRHMHHPAPALRAFIGCLGRNPPPVTARLRLDLDKGFSDVFVVDDVLLGYAAGVVADDTAARVASDAKSLLPPPILLLLPKMLLQPLAQLSLLLLLCVLRRLLITSCR